MGIEFLYGGDKNILKWVVVKDIQLCEYTKRH